MEVTRHGVTTVDVRYHVEEVRPTEHARAPTPALNMVALTVQVIPKRQLLVTHISVPLMATTLSGRNLLLVAYHVAAVLQLEAEIVQIHLHNTEATTVQSWALRLRNACAIFNLVR